MMKAEDDCVLMSFQCFNAEPFFPDMIYIKVSSRVRSGFYPVLTNRRFLFLFTFVSVIFTVLKVPFHTHLQVLIFHPSGLQGSSLAQFIIIERKTKPQ